MTTPSGGGPLHHDDESAYAFAGTGQLLGVSELDKIVQNFSAAVDKLSTIVGEAGQSYRGGLPGAAGTAAGGAGGFSALLNAIPGASMQRAQQARGGPGTISTAPAGTGGGGGGGGFTSLLPGGGGSWYGGGGGGAVPAGTAGGGGGGGGPGGPGGGGPPGSGAGSGGLGGGAGLAGFARLLGGSTGVGVAAFAGGYALSKFSNFANNSLPQQVTMSSYLGQQMSLTSAQGRGTTQSILNQAFGNNAMATGVSDAASGQATLNAISGFTGAGGAGGAPGYAAPLAKSAASYNALLNYTNGLSYSQSAGLTSMMMSPQVGMNFLRMGLGNIAPMQIGGKTNTNAAAMFEGLSQRLAPGENTNQLRYNLRSGGVLSSELGQLFGASGSQLESLSTSMLDVSKLQSQGIGPAKINQLMQSAGSGNRPAQQQLEKYGVNLTDLQSMKDVQSTQTSKQADIEQGFAGGLQDATANLQEFNNMLNALLKNPAIAQITGYTAGYKSAASNQGGVVQSIIGGVAKPFTSGGPFGTIGSTVGRVGGFFSHLLGGGAGPTAKTQVKTAGSSPKNTNTSSVPQQASVAVRSAESQLGVPYKWGGETPGVGYDCCLVPSALVQTTRGPVPIAEINPGDEVYCWETGEAAIRKVLARSAPRRQMTYRISTNRRSLDASGNHPFHVVRTGVNQKARLDWVRLDEVKPGDHIVVMDGLPDNGSLPADSHRSSAEYLWLLGAMFADGHIGSRKTVYLCKFGDKRDRMRGYLEIFTQNKVTYHPTHGMYCSDAALARQFLADGLDRKSAERTLPDWIWQLPHKLLAAFLDGYTTGDGSTASTKNYHAVEYKAANRRLIEQVRSLCMILSINATKISCTERRHPIVIRGRQVRNARPLWCFEAYPSSSRKAHGYLSGRPAVRALFPSPCFMPEKVLSIKPLHEQDTFDIEVEGAHNFIADGINVHNSGLVQWAYEQAGVALPRTSQAQSAFLAKRRIPLDKAQAGDILFAAGSDGTDSAPGHEAMMVSQKQLIQAPFSGQNVQIDPYEPGQWLFAARPAGSLSGSATGGSTTGNTSSSTSQGNAGAAPAAENAGLGLATGTYGSIEELQAIQGALLGAIAVGEPPGTVSSSGGNTQSAGTTASGASSSAKGGSVAANQAIARQLMSGYGWSSAQEWSALAALWQQESSWSQYADTRKTGAGGDSMKSAVFAYGIAQARPYSKMPKSGWPADKGGSSNAGAQITWGLNYIKGAYVDPVHAEQHEKAIGWYGTGTNDAARGWAVVGERGPELMKLSGGQQIINASQSAHIARQDAKAPQSHPYASMLTGNFSLPDLPSQTGGLAAGGRQGGDFILNFNENSISLGSGATRQDAANFADAVARAVQHNQTLQAVAGGALHG